MYFCDLCVTNLKVFTHERKFYNRKNLVEHRRNGDPDDTSFKGHPLCEFCDERFIDDVLIETVKEDGKDIGTTQDEKMFPRARISNSDFWKDELYFRRSKSHQVNISSSDL